VVAAPGRCPSPGSPTHPCMSASPAEAAAEAGGEARRRWRCTERVAQAGREAVTVEILPEGP
jgi:hypothetical protein